MKEINFITNPKGSYLENLYCPWSSNNTLCGDWCPHFGAREQKDKFLISLYCVPTVRTIVLEKKESSSGT